MKGFNETYSIIKKYSTIINYSKSFKKYLINLDNIKTQEDLCRMCISKNVKSETLKKQSII